MLETETKKSNRKMSNYFKKNETTREKYQSLFFELYFSNKFIRLADVSITWVVNFAASTSCIKERKNFRLRKVR